MAAEEFQQLVRELAVRNPEVTELQFIRDEQASVKLTVLGAGSSNHVIRVESKDGTKGVIVKYAPPTQKSFESTPVTQERVHVEFYCLRRWHLIKCGSVPAPYCLDTDHHVFAMEDLGQMKNLSEDINKGVVDLGVAREVATIVGRVHAATWREDMADEDWKQLEKEVVNEELRRFKTDFEFVVCLDEKNEGNKMEGVVLDRFLEVKDELTKYMKELNDRFTGVQCLVHNDLHSSSVMVSDSRISILDMEFSMLGLAGYDVAYLINSYLICYYCHDALRNGEASAHLSEAIKILLETYLDVMGPTLDKHGARGSVMTDIAVYSAWAAFRIPTFAEIELHFSLTPPVTVTLLEVAINAFRNYTTVRTVDDFMKLFVRRP